MRAKNASDRFIDLGSITSASNCKGDPLSMPNTPYIGLEHIEKDLGIIKGQGTAADVRSTKTVFRKGDLLYGKLRPYLNKVWVAQFDGICSTDILVYPKTDSIDNGFLKFRFMTSDFIDYATSNSNGVNLPRVNAKVLARFSLWLPSPTVQHRIVAEIEKQFTRLEAGVAALKRAQANLKRYRAAVLKTAVTGKLTEKWRAEQKAAGRKTEPASEFLKYILVKRRKHWKEAQLANYKKKGKKPPKNWEDKYKEPKPPSPDSLAQAPTLPEGWAWATLKVLAAEEAGAICAGPFGTIFKAKDFRPEGIPIIFLRHVKEARYSAEKPGFMDTVKWEELFRPYSVFGGEVLVTKMGDPPGVSAIYPEGIGPAMVTPDVIKMTVNRNACLPRYLMHYLNSEIARKLTFGAAYGTTRPRVTLPIFKGMVVPLPPVEEQKAILDEIERHISVIESAEETIDRSAKRATRLRQSILSKAFSNELLPQDSNRKEAECLPKSKKLIKHNPKI